MQTYLEERQPLYGLIGILVVLFGAAVAGWLYFTG